MNVTDRIAGNMPPRAPIHFVLWRAEPGGMENYAASYVRHFRSSRKTHLFSLRPGPNDLTDEVDGYSTGYASNRAMYTAYFRYCRRCRHDRFHLLNSGPVLLLLTLLAGVRRPVYHIHGTLFWKGTIDRWFLRCAWWMTLPFRPVLVANSHYTAATFKRTAVPFEPVVVSNGFDAAPLLAGRRHRTQLRRMAYVGRMARGKNAELAVRAFDAIAGNFPELELHLAGTGPEEDDVREHALSSPYRRRIFFHGWVKDMPTFYASVDLVLFPSSHESFGNVLAEAIINGLPVLTSDLPAFAEIHGDRSTFSLGAPLDGTAFIRNFVAAVERYAELAEKVFALSGPFAERFDMGMHLNSMERIHADAEIGKNR